MGSREDQLIELSDHSLAGDTLLWEGIKAIGPADQASAALNKRLFPPPAKCPCPPPLHIWSGIQPGATLQIALVYDLPTNATSLRFVPRVEDAPAVIVR